MLRYRFLVMSQHQENPKENFKVLQKNKIILLCPKK
jgi:hypothetical protein